MEEIFSFMPFTDSPSTSNQFVDSSGRMIELNSKTAESLNANIRESIKRAKREGYVDGYNAATLKKNETEISEKNVSVDTNVVDEQELKRNTKPTSNVLKVLIEATDGKLVIEPIITKNNEELEPIGGKRKLKDRSEKSNEGKSTEESSTSSNKPPKKKTKTVKATTIVPTVSVDSLSNVIPQLAKNRVKIGRFKPGMTIEDKRNLVFSQKDALEKEGREIKELKDDEIHPILKGWYMYGITRGSKGGIDKVYSSPQSKHRETSLKQALITAQKIEKNQGNEDFGESDPSNPSNPSNSSKSNQDKIDSVLLSKKRKDSNEKEQKKKKAKKDKEEQRRIRNSKSKGDAKLRKDVTKSKSKSSLDKKLRNPRGEISLSDGLIIDLTADQSTSHLSVNQSNTECKSCGNESSTLTRCRKCDRWQCGRCISTNPKDDFCVDCKQQEIFKYLLNTMHRDLWNDFRDPNYITNTFGVQYSGNNDDTIVIGGDEGQSRKSDIEEEEEGRGVGENVSIKGKFTSRLPILGINSYLKEELVKRKHKKKLKFNSESSYKILEQNSKKRIRFHEDFPSSNYNFTATTTNTIENSGYTDSEQKLYETKVVRQNAKNMRSKLKALEYRLSLERRHIVAGSSIFHQDANMCLDTRILQQHYTDDVPDPNHALCKVYCDNMLRSVVEYMNEVFKQIDYIQPIDGRERVSGLLEKIPRGLILYDSKKKALKTYLYREDPGVIIGDRWTEYLGVTDHSFAIRRQFIWKIIYSWEIANKILLSYHFKGSLLDYTLNEVTLRNMMRQAVEAAAVGGAMGARALAEAEIRKTRSLAGRGMAEMYLDSYSYIHGTRQSNSGTVTVLDLRGSSEIDTKNDWDFRVEEKRAQLLVNGTYTIARDNAWIYGLLSCALQPNFYLVLFNSWERNKESELDEYADLSNWYDPSTDVTVGETIMGDDWHDRIFQYTRLKKVYIQESKRTALNPVFGDLASEYRLLEMPEFYRKFYIHTYSQFIVEHLGSKLLTYNNVSSLDVLEFEEITPVLFRVAEVTDGDWDLPKWNYYQGLSFSYNKDIVNEDIDYSASVRDFPEIEFPPDMSSFEIETFQRYEEDRKAGFPILYKEEYKRLVDLYFPSSSYSNSVVDVLDAYKVLISLGITGCYINSLNSGEPNPLESNPFGSDDINESTISEDPLLGKEMLLNCASLMGSFNLSELVIDEVNIPIGTRSEDMILDAIKGNSDLQLEDLCKPKERPGITTFLKHKLVQIANDKHLPYYYIILEFLGRLRLVWNKGIEDAETTKFEKTEEKSRTKQKRKGDIKIRKVNHQRESTFSAKYREGSLEKQLMRLASGKWDAEKDTLRGNVMNLLAEYGIMNSEEVNLMMYKNTRETYKEFWREELGIEEEIYSPILNSLSLEDVKNMTTVMSWIQNWSSPEGNGLRKDKVSHLEDVISDLKEKRGVDIRNIDSKDGESNEIDFQSEVLEPLLEAQRSKKKKDEDNKWHLDENFEDFEAGFEGINSMNGTKSGRDLSFRGQVKKLNSILLNAVTYESLYGDLDI